MNLETKITIYKFTPQLFTLTPLSFSKLLIAFDYQRVRNQNQVFHLECGTNKKREKVTPLDIKSHFRTVFVLQQLCYTSHKCVTL